MSSPVLELLSAKVAQLATRIGKLEKRPRHSHHFEGQALANALVMRQMLPGLRMLVPFSSNDESLTFYDMSHQGRALTRSGGSNRPVLPSGLPYYSFNGTDQYLYRLNEPGLNPGGSFVVGAWVYVTNLSSIKYVISKWTSSGNQGCYYLAIHTNGNVFFVVTTDGITNITATYVANVQLNTWYFIAGKFASSTSLSTFVNDARTEVTSGIPSSVFTNTPNFLINGVNGGNFNMGGGVALPFYAVTGFITDEMLFNLYQNDRTLFGV